MSIVILIAIIAIAVLLCWAIDNIPGLTPPAPAILKLIILLVAIVAIANRAGFL
jgi:hypothetical protein